MKKVIYLTLIALLFFSCQQDNLYIELEPSFEITTMNGASSANIYEDIQITITGGANKMTLFTGDANHHVDSVGKDPLTTGLYVEKGDVVTFQYVVKGKYEITLLGSSFNDMGEGLERKEFTQEILVTDEYKRNDVWDLYVQADGGKIFYFAHPKLKDVDSIGIPGASFESTQLIQSQRADDGNFYIDVNCEFRQGRSKDDEDQFAKYTLEIPFANNGFEYTLKGETYNSPVLRNLYRDQENFLFDEVDLEYAPYSNPEDISTSKIYILPVPELKKLVFKDADGRKVDDIITENFNPIFGETKPVYTQYFPDYNDIHKFYGVIEYEADEADKLNNLKLSFEHRLPADMVTVEHNGKVLNGEGGETVDLSNGSVRLHLSYKDEYFISRGVDPSKATSKATLDIYAFPE